MRHTEIPYVSFLYGKQRTNICDLAVLNNSNTVVYVCFIK